MTVGNLYNGQDYYQGLLKEVGDRIIDQYSDDGALSLDSVLDGIELEGTKRSIVEDFARTFYNAIEKEEAIEDQFLEQVKPYKRKGRITASMTGYGLGFGLTYLFTKDIWPSVVGAIFMQIATMYCESNFRTFSSHFAGIKPRKYGDSYDPNLFLNTVRLLESLN